MGPTPPPGRPGTPIPIPYSEYPRGSRISKGKPTGETPPAMGSRVSRDGGESSPDSTTGKVKSSSRDLLRRELDIGARERSGSLSKRLSDTGSKGEIPTPAALSSTPSTGSGSLSRRSSNAGTDGDAPSAPLPSPQTSSPISSSRSNSVAGENSDISLSSSPRSAASASPPSTPKPRALQLLDIHFTSNTKGEFTFKDDGVVYHYVWFVTTLQLLTAIDQCLRSPDYNDKQKESLITLVIRLYTMKRAIPLNHQELASINAIREACKTHPQADVKKRGDQLENLLKPQSVLPSSPGLGAIRNSHVSLEPKKEEEKLRQTCLSVECSQKKETAAKMAKALFDLSLRSLQRICLDEFYLEMKKKTFGPPPNLTASIEQFNILSNFVAYEITKLETQTPKARATIYKFFIILCDQLFKLKDFNSCMALLGGLNKSAVTRLRSVMDHVDKKYMRMLEQLNAQMDPLKGVRQRMSSAEADSAPYIPYIGIFLTDLTHITENHKFDDPVINPDSPTKISAPLTLIAKAQLILPYNLETPKMMAYFESWRRVYFEWIDSDRDPEEILLERSYKIEPMRTSPRAP